MLMAIGTCAHLYIYIYIYIYITCTMIRRNITNHSLEMKKAPCFNLFSGKQLSFMCFVLKMENFVLKVKPKKICKLNKLKHLKFLLKNIVQFA